MHTSPHPHPLLSFVPLASLVGLVVAVIAHFPHDALAGPFQVSLMLATLVCVALAMGVCGMRWATFEEQLHRTMSDISTALIILLLIGMLSATWMVSGVVPTLIYYGVQLMEPAVFLPCVCVVSALVSVVTGTSWTTIATIGVAFMGVGEALGIPQAFTAGAIISGSYFGDKVSPMSDTTVLASSVAGVDLFAHIRYMLHTTVPSMGISLVLYLLLGLHYGGEPVDVTAYMAGLEQGFHISLWTMLVPAFAGVLIWRRTPSLLLLLLSALAAGVYALVMQPQVLAQIAGATEPSLGALYEGLMRTCYTATHVPCGHASIDALVATRGMSGMMDTVWLVLCAACFGAGMTASGMLQSITCVLLRAARGTVGLVASTAASGLLLNMVLGDQFLAIIMNSSMYRHEYRSRGFRPELLSRTTEDSTTVTSVLIPWSSCGITQSTVLGVSTISYLPFCFFNIISPIMSCIVAGLGRIPRQMPPSEESRRE